MKPDLPTQHYQEFVVIETSSGLPWYPGSTNIDDERSRRPQDTQELLTKRLEPIQVLVRIYIAVLLLPDEAERRARDNQVNGFWAYLIPKKE